MKRMLITGAGGQVGQKLCGASAGWAPDWRVFAFNRSGLDITSPEDIRHAFRDVRPDLVVNAAAYTAVDKAESDAERARAVNVDGAARLAAACQARHCRFVHFSTDYVYDEGYDRPLREDDRTLGTSVYARTKLQGENAVFRQYDEALILRTSWVYAEYGHNFFRTMVRLGRERDALRVVNDQIGSPTYAKDLAEAALTLARSAAPGGLYNFANAGHTSWHGLATRIHELLGITCNVAAIPTKDYPLPAKRPRYSVLDTAKIQRYVSAPRSWDEALTDCVENFRAVEARLAT